METIGRFGNSSRKRLGISVVLLAILFLGRPHYGVASEQEGLRLGVQAHFAHGWSLNRMAKIVDAGAEAFRDGLNWQTIEYKPGEYYFGSIAPFMSRAAQLGLEPLLVFHGVHSAYDNNQTPYSDEGRRAFAEFVTATVGAFPEQIRRVEIGNEVNAPNFTVGPFKENPEANYAKLVGEVFPRLKKAYPDVEVVCTGAHSVALGYFRKLFENDVLDSCDAISIHPYRPVPEGIDREISQLQAMMNEFGVVKPIHITEFGSWFEDPQDAPDFMLKMVALLGDAGVNEAYWYALYDEPWWPNMGLFDIESRDKPAAPAFRFITTHLLPLGRAHHVGESSVDRVYSFGGTGRGFVAWGADAAFEVDGQASFFDSSGNEISNPPRLSDSPIIVLGEDLSFRVIREASAYDSLLQFQSAPWSYHAAADGDTETELSVQEGNWGPYLGNRYLNPLGVSDVLINGSFFDGVPMRAIERFTAPESGTFEITASWTAHKPEGDGADVRVSRGSEILASAVVQESEFALGPLEVELIEGEFVDFSVGPNLEHGGDVLERRIQIRGPIR